MSVPRRRPICDARRVGGIAYRHALGPSSWQLTAPNGALYSLCSPACLIAFICEAAASEESWDVFTVARSTTPSGTAG